MYCGQNACQSFQAVNDMISKYKVHTLAIIVLGSIVLLISELVNAYSVTDLCQKVHGVYRRQTGVCVVNSLQFEKLDYFLRGAHSDVSIEDWVDSSGKVRSTSYYKKGVTAVVVFPLDGGSQRFWVVRREVRFSLTE
jgi:hypothetical protein